MKSKVLLLLCMMISLFSFGQKNMLPEASISPVKFSESRKATPAMQKDQTQSIEKYLYRNVIYPQKSAQNFIQGTSVVQFVVSATGVISDFKVINSVSPEIDAEVIRVLETTEGMWIPGTFNGRPENEGMEVAVTFRLSDPGKNKDFDFLSRSNFTKGCEMFLVKNDPKKALRYYDKGMVLVPKDKSLLLMRGMARYEAGDKKGALQDWNRIKDLGGLQSEDYLEKFSDFKGLAEMTQILK